MRRNIEWKHPTRKTRLGRDRRVVCNSCATEYDTNIESHQSIYITGNPSLCEDCVNVKPVKQGE